MSGIRTGGIRPSDLPAPPQVAMQIMRACSRDDVSNTELARMAASDPVLTAELLRVVNSAYFGLARKVKSIPHTVTVLGLRALRNLALCISVRDALKQGAMPGFDPALFWEDSLRRAVSARLLGVAMGLDRDECFTAGLLQDFGLLVMFFVYPDQAKHWPDLRAQDPRIRYRSEKAAFGTTHDQVSMMLARAWALPNTLAQALGYHHSYDRDLPEVEADKLCRVLHSADWLAAVFQARDKGAVITRCRRIIFEDLEMDGQHFEQCLNEVPVQVEEAAVALGLRIEHQADLEQVLREANVRLAEENLSYQELTWQLEKALKERDRLAEELGRELELARAIQRSLLPPRMAPDYPVVGINVPARGLSGDFYDYFTLPDGRVYFALGDVSGKGINAALLMAKTSSLFHCLGKREHDPGKLLAQINTELCETSTRGVFVTMVAGLYYPGDGRICLVNAGHPPALLVKNGVKVRELEARSPPLGIVPDSEFPKVNLSLAGGSLYVFSDGITEGSIADGDRLGVEGFLEMVGELVDRPPRDRLDAIVDRFRATSFPYRDDITVLIIEDNSVAS